MGRGSAPAQFFFPNFFHFSIDILRHFGIIICVLTREQ